MSCPEEAVSYADKCIQLNPEKVSSNGVFLNACYQKLDEFDDMVAPHRSWGVFTPLNSGDNTELVQLLHDQNIDEVFIGADYKGNEGKWIFKDIYTRETLHLNYTNWAPGHPEGRYLTQQGVYVSAHDGLWRTTPYGDSTEKDVFCYAKTEKKAEHQCTDEYVNSCFHAEQYRYGFIFGTKDTCYKVQNSIDWGISCLKKKQCEEHVPEVVDLVCTHMRSSPCSNLSCSFETPVQESPFHSNNQTGLDQTGDLTDIPTSGSIRPDQNQNKNTIVAIVVPCVLLISFGCLLVGFYFYKKRNMNQNTRKNSTISEQSTSTVSTNDIEAVVNF